MVKVEILQSYKEYTEGKVYNVNGNEAHTLIDKKVAKLYKEKEVKTYKTTAPKYTDKMMRTKSLKK